MAIFLSLLTGATLLLSVHAAAFQTVSKIFNGSDVPRNAYPFMVSIARSGDHFCGGTIISPRVVLTAAHCLTSSPPTGSLRVRAGGIKLNRPGTFNFYRVDRYELHPFYDADFGRGGAPGSRTVSRNDIAVVYLQRAAEETPAVINVDRRIEAAGAAVRVLGWGRVNVSVPRDNNELLQADLIAVSRSFCASRWAEANAPVGTGTVCATDFEGRRDACVGDSGGPLLGFKTNGQPRLVGLVSAGDTQCRDRAPGIYTRVSDYHCWLEGLGVPGISSPSGPCDATRLISKTVPTQVRLCIRSAEVVARRLADNVTCGTLNIQRILSRVLRTKCEMDFCKGEPSTVCDRKLARFGRATIRSRC